MHTQPNPTPLATLIRSEGTVSGHRNLYCFHYDACLDVAVRLDYGGVEHRVVERLDERIADRVVASARSQAPATE